MSSTIKRPVHVLVECPGLIASVRVGVLEPLVPLEKLGKCEVRYARTLDIRLSDIEWCDVLICVRGAESATLQIVRLAKKAGCYIVYFLDDDLLHVPEEISSAFFYNNDIIKISMINCMKLSDILWCVNPLIAENYKKYFKKIRIGAVPISLSQEQKVCKTDRIKVLYAGSVDHTQLVRKLLTPAIKKLVREYGNKVLFTFIGVDPGLGYKEASVKYYEYIDDYDQYQNLVCNGGYKIGLAVIGNDNFYKCKYFNKYIEYTKIGCTGIYTNNAPYTFVIHDKNNGYLVHENNPNCWYDTIKHAIENKNECNACITNAKAQLIKDYNYSKVSKKLTDDIPELVSFNVDYKFTKCCKILILIGQKYNYYSDRFKIVYNNYGLMSIYYVPLKILQKLRKAIAASGSRCF